MRKIIFAVAAFLLAGAAWAQSYPSKPVRIVIHFPAGGSTDTVARILAQPSDGGARPAGGGREPDRRRRRDRRRAGRQVAAGRQHAVPRLADRDAAGAAAAQEPALRSDQPDFTPIGLVGQYVFVLVASPALDIKTGADLIRYAKANPGKLNFGTYSSGGQLFLAQLKRSGLDLVQCPTRARRRPSSTSSAAART